MSNPTKPLPPGQKELNHFPRYGLYQFANRIQAGTFLKLGINAQGGEPVSLDERRLAQLPRVEQISDFHCVTTWSVRDIQWAGYRFRDFYEQIVVPRISPPESVRFVVFRSTDGYRTHMNLTDLLKADVLLADRVNGSPLGWEHGGPLRLVAPAHYGYKNAKHLCEIEFCTDLKDYRPPALHWHEHPRARVALEERGRFLPMWLQRYINMAVVTSVMYWFRRAAKKHFINPQQEHGGITDDSGTMNHQNDDLRWNNKKSGPGSV